MNIIARLVLLLLGIGLAGCATSPPTAAPVQEAAGESDAGQVDPAWRPQLLYLLSTPHPRLYVEVEAVQGCAPKDATLRHLHDFLATYCEKPEGIQIVRSRVITRAEARGMPPRALARKFMGGPPEAAGRPAPAYMYILYYDSALEAKPLPMATNQLTAGQLPQNRHPHADILPYPAIYMNVRYGYEQWVPKEILMHEAGHLLGLASRKDHATNRHCLDPNCVMNRILKLSLDRVVLGEHPTTQIQLCSRCRQDLINSLKLPAPTNLGYAGPVLVRSEEGYTVLALPYRVKVIFGGYMAQDSRDFAAEVRAEPPAPGDEELRFTASIKGRFFPDLVHFRDTIDRAKTDIFPAVRMVAEKVWLQWLDKQAFKNLQIGDPTPLH